MDSNELQSLIDHAVEEALNSFVSNAREQITRRVVEMVEPRLAAVATGESSLLNDALVSVQAGNTQVQILDALIDGAGKFAVRTALFVVRGANAVGWRAKGFSDNDAVRSSPLELTMGLPGQAAQLHAPVSGPSSEFMIDFDQRFGSPAEPCLVFPLMVRDKMVAIVYADGGSSEQRLDRPALEALIRVTGLWLEVFATRKIAGPVPSERPAAMAAAAAAAPAHPLRREGERKATAVAPASVLGVPAVAEAAQQVETPAPAASPIAAPRGPDADEVHKKARRFAKLLVDEIKLYNQTKVSEGRTYHDLYDRLHDDIEKSRASYEKRYGNTSAKGANYFNQELIRILADNDVSLMGGNFPR